MMDSRAGAASAEALDWLVAHQTSSGEVSCWSTSLSAGPPTWSRDSLCFVTALVAATLDEIDDPRASRIVDRAIAFLRSERETAAQWRYWAGSHRLHDLTPPDADDTACCSMAVARRGDDTEANVALLLAHRDPDGRFHTWLTPRRDVRDPRAWWGMRGELTPRSRRARRELWAGTEADAGDVDLVVNANVCRYLGPDRAPPEAVRWIVQTIRAGHEGTADKWHRNRFTAYASVADGARRGILPFGEVATTIATRVDASVRPDGTVGSALDTAHALLALQALDRAPGLQHRLAQGLIDTQHPDGHWERSVFYHGGPSESVGWASEALTTACAAAALAHGAGVLPVARPAERTLPPPSEASSRRHVLSVLARADRDEAATTALELMRWLHRERPSWPTSTVILEPGGALDGELEALGPTVWVQRRPDEAGRPSPLNRVRQRLRVRSQLRRLGPADQLHVHGLVARDGLRHLPSLRVAAETHHLYATPAAFDATTLGGTNGKDRRYVTVSTASAEWVGRRLGRGVPVTSHGGLAEASCDGLWPATAGGGLPHDPGSFAVLAVGTDAWDDGADLFARVAWTTAQLDPIRSWHFLWVGLSEPGTPMPPDPPPGLVVEYRSDPIAGWGVLAEADVFLTLAREDASRGALAAAQLGVPTLAFATGRAADLLRASRAGTVVAYPDVAAMAAALVALAEDPARRLAAGRLAQAHVRAHLTVERLGPTLIDGPSSGAAPTP